MRGGEVGGEWWVVVVVVVGGGGGFISSLSSSDDLCCSRWQIHGMRIDAGGTARSDKGGMTVYLSEVCLQSHCDALLPFFVLAGEMRGPGSLAIIFLGCGVEDVEVEMEAPSVKFPLCVCVC